MGCSCHSEAKPEIWLCPTCHIYRKDKRTFTSVTTVIRAVCPPDYGWIKQNRPWILENARLRGHFVDKYFCEWLVNQDRVLDLGMIRERIEPEFPQDGKKHAEDTINRLAMLFNWWEGQTYKVQGVQGIVYDEEDGIAGSYDIKVWGAILDLKCTSKVDKSYEMQLGAYSEYSEQEEVGVIHCTDRKVKMVEFDAKQCRREWRKCLEEYNSN